MKSMPDWPDCRLPGRGRVVTERRDRSETRDGDLRITASLETCRAAKFLFPRWRPSSSRSCPKATGTTSRNGTGFAACSRTTAASWRSGAGMAAAASLLPGTRRAARKAAPPHSALDGEIVISQKGRLEFDAMQMRLHPAESRVRKLSAEIPARFVAFDILLWKGEPLHKLPLEKRRRSSSARPSASPSPRTRPTRRTRSALLDRLEAAGLDGVVAKRKGLPPGLARGCGQGQEVQDGRLRDRRLPLEREGERPDLDASSACTARTGDRFRRPHPLPGGCPPRARGAPEDAGARQDQRRPHPGWPEPLVEGKELDWNPVRPELVCEVRYDKLEEEPLPARDPSSAFAPTRIRSSARGASAALRGGAEDRPSSRYWRSSPRRSKRDGEARLMAPHAGRRIADLSDPLRHRLDRERRRVDSETSSQSSGAETRASGVGRTE